MAITEGQVLQALSQVYDPELNRDIVSLGMVRNIHVDGDNVGFELVLTTPACPFNEQIKEMAYQAVAKLPEVKQVNFTVTAEVPKGVPEKTPLIGIKNIIAIGSGKGGVGKSTVAVNLAIALAKMGAKVGLLDADIYGPNIPRMLGVWQTPEYDGEKILPINVWNIKVMSMGFLLNEDQPVIWRGPILAKALQQLLFEVRWGELDYLLVDLPPGCLTADTQVFTELGPVPISKVKEGMEVYSFDGHIYQENFHATWTIKGNLVKRKVVSAIPQGKAQVYELRTDTLTIKGTSDHPILSVKRVKRAGIRFYEYELTWKRLSVLEPDDILMVIKKVPDNSKANVGYCLGDGFVIQTKGDKQLKLHERALMERMPLSLLTLPTDQKSAFIEGHCDADGYWRAFKPQHRKHPAKRVRMPSTEKVVLKTFWDFETNSSAKTDLYDAGPAHEFFGFERVKELRSIGVEEVYDLHVEGEHNFIANGFIVHNTGDIQMSLSQLVPVTGAVIVTTPQNVALYDALKGLSTFERLNVAVLGIIENMSYFVCPHCTEQTQIFRQGAVEAECQKRGIRFLGSIPLIPEICEGSDLGQPIVAFCPDSSGAKAFMVIASQLAASVSVRNLTLEG